MSEELRDMKVRGLRARLRAAKKCVRELEAQTDRVHKAALTEADETRMLRIDRESWKAKFDLADEERVKALQRVTVLEGQIPSEAEWKRTAEFLNAGDDMTNKLKAERDEALALVKVREGQLVQTERLREEALLRIEALVHENQAEKERFDQMKKEAVEQKRRADAAEAKALSGEQALQTEWALAAEARAKELERCPRTRVECLGSEPACRGHLLDYWKEAPALISQLKDGLKAAKEERDELDRRLSIALKTAKTTAELAAAAGEAASADDERLRIALTYYADPKNWVIPLSRWNDPVMHPVDWDKGEVARAALEGREPVCPTCEAWTETLKAEKDCPNPNCGRKATGAGA